MLNNKLNNLIKYIRDLFYYKILVADSNALAYVFSVLKHNRQVLMMYGDCHMSVYGSFLYKNAGFKRKYLIIGEYDIDYLNANFKKYISNIDIWRKADVLIYNPNMPERYDGITLNSLKENLKDTKWIEISTACFKGYFPQHTSKKPVNNGKFAGGDSELNKLLEKDEISSEEILKIQSLNFYSSSKVNKHWENSLHLLELMEKDSDVKIADYIRENGRKRVLYNSVTHPTVEVFEVILRRLLDILGCDNDVKRSDIRELSHHCEAIYPSVYHHLGIESNCEDRYFRPGIKGTPVYNFIQYVEKYLEVGMEQKI